MATEENLLREAQHWIEDEGGVMPPGNAAESHLWSPSALSSSDEDDQGSSDAVVSPFSQATVGPIVAHASDLTPENATSICIACPRHV